MSNAFETDALKHIFQNAAVALIGDASGLQPSATAGSLYISLHTADPGEAGDQSTSEATFTSYARVAVARTSAQWPESAGTVSNANTITFPASTGGSNTITHVGIGASASGAGKLLFSAALSVSKSIASGDTFSFAASGLQISLD